MLKILQALLVAGAVGFSVGVANATVITDLTNTGVNVTGGIDNAWIISSSASDPALPNNSPAYTNATNGVFPIPPWVSNSPISSWDTPYNPLNSNTDPAVDGTYKFQTTFNLVGSSSGAFITGQFAADNEVAAIKVNGTTIYTGPGFPTSQYSNWTGFSALSGFVAGSNTIEFDLVNYAQNGGNPGGLNVQFLTASVPEPSTWAMMILGFLGVGFMAYRRKSGSGAALRIA
ncbi:PEP-CTERM protein-sorting domain-containing protein [Bradyrhizobium erythrophlei]|nr:PEP-CTERM protein-sorting domain-containing protein [Bradyrhizobium erythrophlei]